MNGLSAEWSAFLKLVIGAIIGVVFAYFILKVGLQQSHLIMVFGVIVAALVGAFGFVVVWKIVGGTIDLKFLISESDGKASLSRFQALVFTFVIAMSYFLLVLDVLPAYPTTANNEHLPPFLPDIPNGVLGLLGISAGTYVFSKGIQKSKDEQRKDQSGRFAR